MCVIGFYDTIILFYCISLVYENKTYIYYYYYYYIEICQISNITAFRITIGSFVMNHLVCSSIDVTDPSIDIWREFEVYLRENVFLFTK